MKEVKKQTLMTKQEVADYLNCHINTVDNWRRIGLLPCVKLKGAIRFRPEDVEEMIKENFQK